MAKPKSDPVVFPGHVAKVTKLTIQATLVVENARASGCNHIFNVQQ